MSTNGESSPSRRTANAYPGFSRNYMMKFSQVGILVVLFFLLRNLLFHDYRTEQIKFLSSAGMTMDEIKRFVPPTPEERRKSMLQQANDMERLKLDVIMLKQDVQLLLRRLDELDEHHVNQDNASGAREDGLSLDEIRFKEEGDRPAGETRKDATKTKQKETLLNLSQLGEIPEGDLLSGG